MRSLSSIFLFLTFFLVTASATATPANLGSGPWKVQERPNIPVQPELVGEKTDKTVLPPPPDISVFEGVDWFTGTPVAYVDGFMEFDPIRRIVPKVNGRVGNRIDPQVVRYRGGRVEGSMYAEAGPLTQLGDNDIFVCVHPIKEACFGYEAVLRTPVPWGYWLCETEEGSVRGFLEVSYPLRHTPTDFEVEVPGLFEGAWLGDITQEGGISRLSFEVDGALYNALIDPDGEVLDVALRGNNSGEGWTYLNVFFYPTEWLSSCEEESGGKG